MKSAIIIPVFNRKAKTLACLKQLSTIDTSGLDITVIVVDDGSTDGTSESVRHEFPDAVVLTGDGNLWWTGAINMGVEYALNSDFEGVLLLNDDLILASDFIVELYNVIKNNKKSLVSSLKLIEDKNNGLEILTAGFKLKGKLKQIENSFQSAVYDEQEFDDVLECDILTGASLYIPADVIRDIGFLNDTKFPHNWGDLEFTWRASMYGYKCLVATRSHVYTEYNPNYHRTYFVSSTRVEYIRHLFDNKKFSYGFSFLFNRSFMHRSRLAGSILYVRGVLSLTRYIALKLVLPKSILIKHFNNL